MKARLRSKPQHGSATPQEVHDVVKYGPKDCISIFKNSRGECIMQTKCVGIDLTNYEFGLTCVDKAGAAVHHLFGKDSFDEEEKFHTQISCNRCLGFSEEPRKVPKAEKSLQSQIAAAGEDIKDLMTMAEGVSADVQRLNVAVFPATTVAPTPAAPPAPAAAAPLEKARASSYVQKGGDNDDEDGNDASEDEAEEDDSDDESN